MLSNNKISESPESKAFRNSLKQCRQAANEGVNAAIQQKQDIKGIMDIVIQCSNQLNFSSDIAKVPEEYKKYKEDLSDVQRKLSEIYGEMDQKIAQYKDKLSHFTITVYGKTMVGKSTLMEVLTHGNGKSIGKGAQRTTRDVREYVWKETGVKFVDVPGVAAAKDGGKQDERLAFEAAKYADLILFLITDDGPQKEEAEAFARVKRLGKPMLCILNVKASGINKEISMKLRIHKVKQRMAQSEDFEHIHQQFYQYASEFGQNWQDVPFLYTDLNTAYLSQQSNNKEDKNLLYELSGFQNVTRTITEQIQTKGTFYQFKTPLEISYNVLLYVANGVLKQYIDSDHLCRDLYNQITELEKVSKKYNEQAIQKLQKFCKHLRYDLDDIARNFAVEHYNDQNAAENWARTVQSLRLEKKMSNVLEELQEDKEHDLEHFSLHIPETLQTSFNMTQARIQGDDPVDTRFIASGLSALTGLSILLPGVGWLAAVGIGIGSLFFGNLLTDSKEKKIRRRQQEMYDALAVWLKGPKKCQEGERPQCFMTTLGDALSDNYDKIYQSFKKTREAMIGYLRDVVNMHKGQLHVWKYMNNLLLKMNRISIQKALQTIQKSEWENSLLGAARIPGEAVLLEFQPGFYPDSQVIQELEMLMQEKVYVLHKKDMPILQAIITLGDLSSEEIDSYSDEEIHLIRIENKVAEKINELKEQRQFVPEELKQKANTINLLSQLLAQLYNYPVYIDSNQERRFV